MSAEESAKIGPTIKSLLVKDRSDNEVYLCISYDTLHIRMQGGEKERSSFQSMAESFNSSNGTTYGTGQKTIDIQGFNCSEWMIKGTYSDTISSYIASQIKLDPSIHDFPLYLSSNGIPKGLMLGRDEKVWNGQTIEFRALKLEINQAQDISAELAAYQLVSKEKGDQLLKALFTQMMGIPQNEGKNK